MHAIINFIVVPSNRRHHHHFANMSDYDNDLKAIHNGYFMSDVPAHVQSAKIINGELLEAATQT